MNSKFKMLLKKVESMSIEEIESVEVDIADDFKKMNDYKTLQQKKAAKKSKPKTIPEKKYKYPFIIHVAGRNMETDHIFETNVDYSEKEITTKMREHQYYDFTGDVSFDYIAAENVLVPIFRQHKKRVSMIDFKFNNKRLFIVVGCGGVGGESCKRPPKTSNRNGE